jgi:hypothetical protein
MTEFVRRHIRALWWAILAVLLLTAVGFFAAIFIDLPAWLVRGLFLIFLVDLVALLLAEQVRGLQQ